MTNNFSRHFATVLLGCLLCTQAYAQHTTKFLFFETAPDYTIKTMQTNANAMFAEINRAYDENKSGLSLSTVNLTTRAITRIQTLWATSHFYCTKTGITEKVLKSSSGYQIRNVPVFFTEDKTNEDKSQDVVLEFTTDGKISDMYIAIAPHHLPIILSDKTEDISDLEHRQWILDYIEHLRTAYYTKDIELISKAFCDALERSTKTGKDSVSAKVDYSVSSKKMYLAKLEKVFASNENVNVNFDNISVVRHEGNPNIYGVTLKQSWKINQYHDEGWLFQIWDFEDESSPQIWVRTWQPLQNADGNPIHYSNEDIFNLSDFHF